tara:strand:+ start:1056 stop:1208 length:153 start_codon:yes stop_codon:yes gene_type:complete
MTEREKWLIDQYNRNRPFEDHIHTMAEYNRVMLDLEIKNIKKEKDDKRNH